MHLVVSGEGASDVGSDVENIGPITKLVDRLIEKRLGYSLVDKEWKALTLFSKAALVDRAKQMKPRSRKGKKQPSETRYFYNNARALALLAGELEIEACLGEPATRLLLNDRIDADAIDLDRMTDLPSVAAFKDRLNEVLDLIGCTRSK